MKQQSKVMNKVIVHSGIKIEQNPLTNDWFIFAKEKSSGKDCSIYGTLNNMKKCAEYAAKNNTIIQVNK